MRTKADAREIVERLKKAYPLAECSLEYENAWQLLVSVRLSAQCTDARVNIVTAELFGRYPTLEALAGAGVPAIEAIVKPCGLGASKARDIDGMCNMLINEFGGSVVGVGVAISSKEPVKKRVSEYTAIVYLGNVDESSKMIDVSPNTDIF